MYAFGDGVPKDYVRAYMWANIARANGHKVSKFKEFLTQKMTQSEMNEAQELSRQYIIDHPEVY